MAIRGISNESIIHLLKVGIMQKTQIMNNNTNSNNYNNNTFTFNNNNNNNNNNWESNSNGNGNGKEYQFSWNNNNNNNSSNQSSLQFQPRQVNSNKTNASTEDLGNMGFSKLTQQQFNHNLQ